MNDPALILLVTSVLAVTVFLVTLVNTNAALTLLIFSMLLSPEISLAQLPGRAVVVRFDDLLLGIVFFSWLAKLAINKELALLRSTPLNVPLGLFTLSCFISTGWGVINETVPSPTASFFYLLKYTEYFALYFMVANVIRERRQAVWFLTAMLITAAIVTGFGYWQMATYGTGGRITTPFEGEHPEPNTLAGYLVVMMGICGGLALYQPSLRIRLLLMVLIAAMILPLVFTYSRGGYVGFLVMYLTLCLLSRRYQPVLFILLLAGIVIVPLVMPQTVLDRIVLTIDPLSKTRLFGIPLTSSAAIRVEVWPWLFERLGRHPFLGFGITGVGLMDSQHALVLGELGVVGFAVYLWIRWRLLTIVHQTFRTHHDPFVKGLNLGFLASLIALLVHSFAANIFIIVRIMEPFWFLAAMVMVLPQAAPTAAQSPSREPSARPAVVMARP